jgi:ribose 5-phosphate isomerase A
MSELKLKAAKAALDYIEDGITLGVGTGSTVNCLIQELVHVKHKIEACVASSKKTERLLRALNLPVIDLNVATEVSLYIDGADEVVRGGAMIKGGGGALTREKILANAANQFICIVDGSKLTTQLGAFPLAVEVIPMARSLVARKLVQLQGDPEYRDGFVTDNGNIIIDVHNLPMGNPSAIEDAINLIPGVVENGMFAHRLADKIIVATDNNIDIISVS